MPIIHIRSLPFQPPQNISYLVTNISNAVSQTSDIDVKHITCSWSFFESERLAVSSVTAPVQPKSTHPIMVELVLPSSHSKEAVAEIMCTITSNLAELTNIDPNNIFVHAVFVESGMVYESGQVIRW